MCMLETTISEPAKTDFSERMMETLNHAAMTLMISIGHRTGLFDAMSKLQPSTSSRIAASADLDERYVREWLGAMVTGDIVTYDAPTQTYRLPAEHAEFLTREASPNNMASVAQFIPLLGCVEEQIVECFHNGGGVPYSQFPRFHEVMMEESDQTVVSALLDSILPSAAGVSQMLHEGTEVMDVGCGSGRALIEMAQAFPQSRFRGYDFSDEAIERANAEVRRRGLTNIVFEVKDVSQIDEQNQFGLITAFDAIHDQARPAEVLACIRRALAENGTFLMQDIGGTSHVHQDRDHALAPLLYTISCMHCMTVSLSAGGAGLGAMWGREVAVRMLREAGFTSVDVKKLDHDELNLYFIAR